MSKIHEPKKSIVIEETTVVKCMRVFSDIFTTNKILFDLGKEAMEVLEEMVKEGVPQRLV